MNARDGIASRGRPVGIGYALASAVLFGLSTPASKVLLRSISPAMMAALLYLGAGIGLAIVRVGRSRRDPGEPLTRPERWALVVSMVVGGVCAPLALMYGLSRTPAAISALLLNLEGVFTALLAWGAFKEHIGRRIAFGMFLIVAGGVLLSWQGTGEMHGWFGPAAIAVACLCWATDNNVTRRLAHRDATWLVAIKGSVAGVANLGIAWALEPHLSSLSPTVAALVLGFVSYGLSLQLFVLALRHLGSTRTSAYFALAPFVGAVASLLVLHESITPTFVPAAVLMAIGLWLHLSEAHAHVHTHPALEHSHAHAHDEHHRHEHPGGEGATEGHTHWHAHEPLVHSHPHYPDIHHRHEH